MGIRVFDNKENTLKQFREDLQKMGPDGTPILVEKPRFCYFCNSITDTLDECCIVCGLSKQHTG